MKKYLIIILITIYSTAYANYPVTKIVATINCEPITMWDIKQFGLIQFFNKNNSYLINNTNILNKLINKKILEKIKIQYIKKINLKIEKNIIEKTILLCSKQNNLSLKKFINLLKKKNINYNKYYNFIKKELLLKKLEQKEIINNIKINKKIINLKKLNFNLLN